VFPPLGERFECLEELLQIAHQMWRGDESPYAGRARLTQGRLTQSQRRPREALINQRPPREALIKGRGHRFTRRSARYDQRRRSGDEAKG
jgi:hypothetical protein